jgi:hypothetical protein
MSTSDIVIELNLKLQATGMADLPGRLLYSGLGTLSPGLLYVLGYNPGGDPETESDSPAQHLAMLAEMPTDWNEYCDGKWRRQCIEQPPGSMPMQRRVCHLLKSIGMPVRSVCASNLFFKRSKRKINLNYREKLTEQCWPVHRFILEQVRPKAILSVGGEDVSRFVYKQGTLLSDLERIPAGWAAWSCSAARIQVGTQKLAIVSVPHLSIYPPDRSPHVIPWVRERLGL